MKLKILTLTVMIVVLCTPSLRSEDTGMKCSCGMMKKQETPATAAQKSTNLEAQSAEIDKLLSAMHGSIGSEKLDAMAALITRLAEQYKAVSEKLGAAQAPKTEAHQH